MRVLLTGAFGNVGQSALEELLRQGHRVRCFDLRTKANERAARRYGDRIEVVWGDLRRPEEVARAVEGQDAVVHLAFIIPNRLAGHRREPAPPTVSAADAGRLSPRYGRRSGLPAASDSGLPSTGAPVASPAIPLLETATGGGPSGPPRAAGPEALASPVKILFLCRRRGCRYKNKMHRLTTLRLSVMPPGACNPENLLYNSL